MTTRLVVVGDTLLDREVDGAVTRLCPDAPAPVLDERASTERPGGAGLAASLAARQGWDVTLVTSLAEDHGGDRLQAMLSAAGVTVHASTMAGTTPEKVRLRAGNQVLLRLDRGANGGGCGEPGSAALAAVRDAGVVLVSDYGRGVAQQGALRSAVASARAPVVWDPHPRGPAPVAHTRLVTPNEDEVRQLTSVHQDRLGALTRAAQQLRQQWQTAAVAVTMADRGALLCHAGPTPLVVPAPARSDGDSCGAGDSFAVAAASALAEGALVTEAVQAAVARASWFVAAGGAAAALSDSPAPTAAGDGAHAAGELVARVRASGGTVVATGGCFDLLHAGHVTTLQAARQLGDCLVVCLNSDASVARLKGPGRPRNGQADRVRVLAALGCVDAVVVFEESTPHAVLSWLRPDVWVKGADYAGDVQDLPESELVRGWDGQTVLVPYLTGRSSTALADAAGNQGR